MKRLRHEQAEPAVLSDVDGPIRFYMCGEYGPLTHRPHYHAVLFNLDFVDKQLTGVSKSGEDMFESELLTKTWGHGRVTLQRFTSETAGYVAGYVMKKVMGPARKDAYKICCLETGEEIQLAPEYSEMSTKKYWYRGVQHDGGIGARWFAKFNTDVSSIDAVVREGKEHQTPVYYDRLLSTVSEETFEEIKFKRVKEAVKRRADATPERLAVRESIQMAKVAKKERSGV